MDLKNEAEIAFKKYSALDTDSVDFKEHISIKTFIYGKDRKLNELFIASKSNNPGDLYNLGKFYLEELRDYKKAHTILARAYKMEPYSQGILAAMGDYYYDLQEFNSAIPFYLKVLEQNTSHQKIINKTAIAYLKTGNIDKAIEYIQLLSSSTSSRN